MEWVNPRYKSIPGVVQQKKNIDGIAIEDVFSCEQSVTRVMRKGKNTVLNVSKGIFPSSKK